MFNVKLMRRLDAQLGNLACSALAAKKKLTPSRTTTPIKKIAVAKFFGMGSIVVASPALAALREAYPDAEIHFITFASNRQILEILGVADHGWYIDPTSPSTFTRSTLSVATSLRKAGIDLLLDLEFFAKFPLVLGGLAGINKLAGFCLAPEPWRRSLLDVAGTYNHYFHTKDIFLSLVYLLKTKDLYYLDFEKFRAQYTYPRHRPSDADLEALRSKLGRYGIAERPLIVINPNTSPELAPEVRKWPEERYAELARRVLEEHPKSVVLLIGAKSEIAYVERIAAHADDPRVVSVAGAFDLRELLALFATSDLVISNDSGPMHLACLVDTPIVGLFFADTPTLFAPLASRVRSVAPELYSLPMFTVYNGKDVVSGLSLEEIQNIPARAVSVERVMTEVRSLLEAPKTPAAAPEAQGLRA